MHSSSHHINDPSLPSKDEVVLARETSRKLAQLMVPEQKLNIKIQGKEGGEISMELPASAVRMLLDILEQMANGNAVSLTPLHAELTTQQAAEMLNISRPYLIKLLEQGKIPFHKVGSHRRILAKDVLEYKQRSYQERRKAMAELTAESQEIGFYN